MKTSAEQYSQQQAAFQRAQANYEAREPEDLEASRERDYDDGGECASYSRSYDDLIYGQMQDRSDRAYEAFARRCVCGAVGVRKNVSNFPGYECPDCGSEWQG